MSNAASPVKKTRQTKESPLENLGFDNSKFIKAPNAKKLIGDPSKIINVTPILIKNIPKEYYLELDNSRLSDTDKARNLVELTLTTSQTTITGTVGFTIHFRGATDNIQVLYTFDPSWLTDGQFNNGLEETEPTFKEWFTTATESGSMCIATDSVRGWGGKKIENTIDLIKNIKANCSINDGITFTIPDDLKPTLTSEKKRLKIKPKTSTSAKENQAGDSPKLEHLLAIIAELGKKQKELEESLQKTNETIASVLSAIKTQNHHVQSDRVELDVN